MYCSKRHFRDFILIVCTGQAINKAWLALIIGQRTKWGGGSSVWGELWTFGHGTCSSKTVCICSVSFCPAEQPSVYIDNTQGNMSVYSCGLDKYDTTYPTFFLSPKKSLAHPSKAGELQITPTVQLLHMEVWHVHAHLFEVYNFLVNILFNLHNNVKAECNNHQLYPHLRSRK